MRSIRATTVILLLVIVAFSALVGRCLQLQYLKHEHYARVSVEQHRPIQFLQRPRRGTICDCRGRVLAASNEVRIVFAEPRLIEDPRETAMKLATIVGMSEERIFELITSSSNPGFAKIKVGADAQECKAASKIRGIGSQCDWQRNYPMQQLASHPVGFTSLDNRGLAGIELEYDEQLNGSPGCDIFLADVQRRPIRLKKRASILSDGLGVVTTIDASIQQFARAELLKRCEKYEAEAGVAIVAEPKTGAILAMVSLPDYDPMTFWLTDANNLRNRAINDQYEPGSIFKPVVAAVGLDTGVVNTKEEIFCENGSYQGRGFGRIGEYKRGFGNLTLRGILVNSSNIGMAKIGQRLGKEKLYEGLKFFGFGEPTGIDLPGEASGLVWPVSEWTGYSVTRVPFGQEVTVTAIQLIRAYCILANGGRLIEPYIIKATVSNDGQIIKVKRTPPPVAYVVKPEVARWIVGDALVGVVNEGTGKRAKLGKWQVFGKTGTANIAKPNEQGYSEDDYVASFIAGAPAEDPAIVVLVSIRKPNKKLGIGYTGGVVASPVAAAIMEKTLTYLERQRPAMN